MAHLMENPFIEDTDEQAITRTQITEKEQPKDKTKDIRGDASKEPWTVKTPKSEAEERRIQRALLNGEYVPGHKKRDPNKVYHRSVLTEKDLLLLHFLAKFDYATTKTLSVLLDIGDCGKRLRGLREWGYLTNPTNTLNITIWMLTSKAINELHDREVIEFKPKLHSKEISLVPFAHTLGIASTAAILLSKDNPYMKATGDAITLENLVGERELLKAMAAYGTKFEGKSTPEQNLSLAREVKAKGDKTLVSIFSPLPDMSLFHRPDLAVILPNNEVIAIEVELTRKSKQDTDNILKSYSKNYFGRIKRVLYVCREDATKNSIIRAKKRVGADNRIVCAPIFNREGKRHTGPTHRL